MKKFQTLMKSRFENAKKDNKGFSLVELIIAVVILGIIAVVAIGGLYGNVRQNTDVFNAQSIQSALSTLSADKGFYFWAKKTNTTLTIEWSDALSDASAIAGAIKAGGATDEALVGGTYDTENITAALAKVCPNGFPAAKAGGAFQLTLERDGEGNVTVKCRVSTKNPFDDSLLVESAE